MKKVVLGLSGGVDSSVAAIKLLEQGYEVIGVTFKFTDNFDANKAINVANKLNIKHYIIDYRKEFKETIIDSFINDYKNGLTPNPCVLCNKEVKFNFLYKKMLELECDYIATGHYAKIIDGRLYVSEDTKKDQTYFLAQIPKAKLNKLILPLEGMTKEDVKSIALKYNLINDDYKDSTDVCFINSSFKEYMDTNINSSIGDVIDVTSNKVIGKHNGLSKYTIGQRKGLNIGGTKERMYVVGKNVLDNILYIATGDNNEYLVSNSCLITNLNLIGDKVKYAKACFRYHQTPIDVELEYINDTEVLVKYNDAKSVTPGQLCAIYVQNECIGSGIIKEIRKDNNKLWYI